MYIYILSKNTLSSNGVQTYEPETSLYSLAYRVQMLPLLLIRLNYRSSLF